MRFKTNYPYIWVHGMLGWGDKEIIYKYLQYYGMMLGNLEMDLENMGFDIYAPSVGSFSSAWDRACELYAQLKGGTVDYGVAHSKEHGHERFGKTYEPFFEGWGSEKKINLFGHSFGGPTIRMLATLLEDGCKEEIDATAKDEISELFTGGKSGWIHSITCIASTHRGTTLMYSMPRFIKYLQKATTYAGDISEGTWFSKIYDFQMGHFGFRDKSSDLVNTKAQQALNRGKDNIYYDLTLHGSRELNEKLKCHDDIYYFSIPVGKTTQKRFTYKRQQKPTLSMSPVWMIFGHSIGKYIKNEKNDIEIDSTWLPNDGLVNVISATCPENQPSIDMHDVSEEYKKGIWHVYDPLPYDHTGILGGIPFKVNRADIYSIYRDHMRLINNI
ncbi:MAG: hypothetical protein LBH71_04305 [Oscillospiraceae bacterium]|jgi:triacylglycerol esterase/lipase EstA (alpha/beta hydrolase family)|nr:hypothetical protein [Oscillospiraceae bacterium]